MEVYVEPGERAQAAFDALPKLVASCMVVALTFARSRAYPVRRLTGAEMVLGEAELHRYVMGSCSGHVYGL